MNYKEWEIEFDNRFVADGSFKVQGNYLEVKDFIKETINALCDELKMEAKTNGKVNITKLSGFHDAGYDTAVGRFNKKLESIKNEPN